MSNLVVNDQLSKKHATLRETDVAYEHKCNQEHYTFPGNVKFLRFTVCSFSCTLLLYPHESWRQEYQETFQKRHQQLAEDHTGKPQKSNTLNLTVHISTSTKVLTVIEQL